jgi:hypothetical protein
MPVQPLDDGSFERPVLELLIHRRLARNLLLFADPAAVLTEGERCHEIGFGLADTIDKCGRDCGRPSAQNEPLVGSFNRRAKHREIVKQIACDTHISASAPGGTASSSASGIGPIGLIGAVMVAPSGLWVL